MNPYRQASTILKPLCLECQGEGRFFEWDGMGGEYEKCHRCNGSGEEPEPRAEPTAVVRNARGYGLLNE